MVPRAAYALTFLLATSALAEPPSPRVLERYRQMLATNPTEGTALDRLWKAYSDSGQTGQLIEEYARGATFPDKMVLGHLQHRAGRDEEAAAAFKAAGFLEPSNPLPVLALAGVRKGAEAAELYERALSVLPAGDARMAPALEALGQAWLAAGQAEKASAAWERTVALDPTNADLRRRLADTYRRNRLPERALPHLQYVAEHTPASERAAAYQEISRQYQTMRRPGEAIAALEQAVALAAPGHWLWLDLQAQLIRLHQRFGRTAELEEKWKQQAGANPRDLGAHLQLVEFYAQTGDLAQQRSWLEKLTVLAPKDVAYRLRLAHLLVELDLRAEAAASYDALLAEQPGQIDAIFERAKLEIQAGTPEKAHARLAAMLKLKTADESVRGRALDFYQQHRLWKEAEELLSADAAGRAEEAVYALANFYFARHRESDGEAVLRRLVPAQAAPRQRAAALVRIAQVLKNQNLLEAAGRALAEAQPLAVGDAKQQREIAVLRGETQAALGAHAEARLSFLEAIRTSETPAQQEEAEQRLFDVLRQMKATAPGSASAAPGTLVPAGTGEEVSITKTNPWIGRYVDDLLQEATQHPSEAGWLRVARWQGWCHDVEAGMESIGHALLLNGQSVAAHEAAVKMATSGATPVVARSHLEALLALEPANAAAYRRRLAQLDLQTGQVGEAIRGLTQLTTEAPGNADLLVELATSQQRAERWEEALATWKAVLAGGSAARRKEAVSSLLRIYERLKRPQPAAELLLADIDTHPDAKEQLEAFKELLTLCQREGLLPWLHEAWADRREGRLDDATGEMAWAQLLKAEGNAEGAFAALSDALYNAPNPADALPELVRQAEELRRLDAAVDFQSRLVRLGTQGRPDALAKLAELQERAFLIGPAGKSWELIVSRFPRDVGGLAGAAEFYLRGGARARAATLLRRVRELEPSDTHALFALARIDLREGELAEAEKCLEQLLDVSPTDHLVRAVRFPAMKAEDSGRVQTAYLRGLQQRRARPAAETMRALRGFWVEAPADSKTEDDLRLSAIRELAVLARTKDDPAALEKWIARWRASAQDDPTEALWALYYAQAGSAALDIVEGLVQREPGNEQYEQGFFWLALQMRQFPRMAAWLYARKRSNGGRDFAYVALSQYLQACGGSIDPELIKALTPPEAKSRFWELAQLCASNSCYAEAVAIGRQALAAERLNRAARSWEIVQWELALGHPEEARRLMMELARQPGESYAAPTYAALRAAYLMLPLSERAAYADKVEAELANAPALHATMTRVLLRGLAGKESAAREEVRKLAHMRVLGPALEEEPLDPQGKRYSAAERAWDFIRDAGARLQGWGLDALAQTLWEEALADPALLRLQGEKVQETARDVRVALLALRVAHADRDGVGELLEKSERGPQALESSGALGEALEQIKAWPRAVEVYARLWKRDPSNGQALRNLLLACRTVDDSETAEMVLQACVSQRLYTLNDNVHRDLVMQLADLLERRGAYEDARKLLATAISNSPYDTRLLSRGAVLTEKTGDLTRAEALWRHLLGTDPAHTVGKLGLAELLVQTGRRREAIAILQKGSSPGVETKLAELLYADGQTDAAITVVERVSGTERAPATRALAAAMLARGDRAAARSLLQAAVVRAADATAAMQLESQLLESLRAPEEGVLIARELLKLRSLAGDDAGRLGVYFAFLQTHAVALGLQEQAQRELTAAWNDGTGLLPAGLVQLSAVLDQAPSQAATVLNQILARRDLTEPWLQAMLPSVTAAKRPELAARIEERLLQLNPPSYDLLLSAVQHHVAAGEQEQALTLLRHRAARGFFDEALARTAAQAWLAAGETAPARQLLAMIAPPRGVLHTYEAFLEHAQLRLAVGDEGPAKALLLRAFEHPGNREYARLVEWLSKTGRQDQWEQALGEFRFGPAQMLGFKRALFASYAALPSPARVVALVEAHPELVDVPRAEVLRAVAQRTAAFAQIAPLLERAMAQAADPAVSLAYVLTLADWAETEQPEAALAHLRLAQEKRPDVYAFAEKLHGLYLYRGELLLARAALVRYLAAAPKDAPERAKAERLMAPAHQ